MDQLERPLNYNELCRYRSNWLQELMDSSRYHHSHYDMACHIEDDIPISSKWMASQCLGTWGMSLSKRLMLIRFSI